VGILDFHLQDEANGMSNLPIRYIILEGVDCSGKTTLYSVFHKDTGFKYNIHDRSFLSMLCYARLYGRDETFYRDSLREELCDANNYLVVLMPPKSTIIERLTSRGDEFQDTTSILKLYDIFDEEVKKIQELPNVLVVKSSDSTQEISKLVKKNVSVYENFTPQMIGSLARMWTKISANREVQYRVHLNVPVNYDDSNILHDPHEGQYYIDILNECNSIIENEVAGRNPYETPQDITSRRFYYSSDTCISSIHFLVREGRLKVIANLRSTDSVKNGSIDLRFLTHLAADVPRAHNWNPRIIDLEVRYNSLHVRHDKV
jgi:thymidylate kinase